MRTLPLHPHCSCVYDPYYRKVKGKRKPWDKAVKETMEKFSEYEQRQILGSKDMLARFKKGEDIEKIFNTIRPKYPIKKYVDVFRNIVIKSNIDDKINNLSLGFGKKVDEFLKDIRDETKKIISKIDKPNEIILHKKKIKDGSYYSSFGKRIEVDDIEKDAKDGGARQTFLHEYGHHIDFTLGKKYSRITFSNNDEFIYAFKRDFLYLKEKFGSNLSIFNYFSNALKNKPYLGSCSDIVDAMFDGKMLDYAKKTYKVFAGHGSKEYTKPIYKLDKQGIKRPTRKREPNWIVKMSETYAQLFRAWAGSEKEWKEMKKVFPNLTNYFEKHMKELLNDS